MTPQEICAELPDKARADCIAAGELLTAPSSTLPTDAHSTVRLRANNGALTIEYREPGVHLCEAPTAQCAVRSAIVSPAGELVYILLTSIDGIYSFEVPGYLEKVELVPGRVNELHMATPAEAGQVGGVLEADANGSKVAVDLRFVVREAALDNEVLCDA